MKTSDFPLTPQPKIHSSGIYSLHSIGKWFASKDSSLTLLRYFMNFSRNWRPVWRFSATRVVYRIFVLRDFVFNCRTYPDWCFCVCRCVAGAANNGPSPFCHNLFNSGMSALSATERSSAQLNVYSSSRARRRKSPNGPLRILCNCQLTVKYYRLIEYGNYLQALPPGCSG
jgi:hypothetical protein